MKEYTCPSNVSKKDIPKIDGMNYLLESIPVEQFIRLSVESSYFFSPSIVKGRQTELIGKLDKGEILIARKTARKEENNSLRFTNETDGFSCVIDYDHFGNDKVIKLINRYTGYTIAITNSIFRNYTISHVWGNAKDPRYFTSFWNLVLIPAWANHLMDKKDTKDNVGTILKNTMMAVCHQVYQMHQLDWKGMSMAEPPQYQEALVQKGTYSVHILEDIKGQRKVGDITKETITIS